MEMMPRVMKGEIYPVHWEEWIDFIAGFAVGAFIPL
jgi:hypothetical protein